jgi:ectoine hydroxylase-related dioxygenase (phytanoyl-CoA dioxygenase family)
MHHDFDQVSLPWLDRATVSVDDYISGLSLADDAKVEVRAKLLHWQQFGYVIFKKLIDPRLIDAYCADVEELFRGRNHSVLLTIEGHGVRQIREIAPEMLKERHLRLMDFHNLSIAGKKIALHPTIVDFLRHVFLDKPVVMQSLTFIHGTEQHTHQDYAYVVAGIPSHLAATWVALEDISPDSGPLVYYPGSHTLPKFDWGNGLFLTSESKYNEIDFARHIESEADRMGLRREVFHAKKGDVFIWHGSLAHGGSAVRDPNLTRRAFVSHYSSVTAYSRDRRSSDRPPIAKELNAGLVYGDPRWPEEEDSFARGAEL